MQKMQLTLGALHFGTFCCKVCVCALSDLLGQSTRYLLFCIGLSTRSLFLSDRTGLSTRPSSSVGLYWVKYRAPVYESIWKHLQNPCHLFSFARVWSLNWKQFNKFWFWVHGWVGVILVQEGKQNVLFNCFLLRLQTFINSCKAKKCWCV